MDDVLTFADELSPSGTDLGQPWKILVADDEPSVHLVTKLALGDFTFEGRKMNLLSAYGEDDTRRIMGEHPDIALILLDVVMDTMDSGFTLVRYIRDTLKNKDVRIIMRTGQSGNAPEDRIIINYDINDFKDKTELTVAKLRTTMISSLRTYSHLKIIAEEQRKSQANRAYLHTIIDSLSSVLITLDLNLKVLLWNKEAERWTGTGSDAAAGRELFEVAPVFGPLKALFQDLLAGPIPGRVERTAVPLWKGEQVFVHLILQTLPGSAGPEILFRLDDRTIAKHQDDQIIRSQKVNAFSALAAGVAGELSRVLHATMGDAVDQIKARDTQAQGLLDRLVRFSPLVTPHRDPQDWTSLIRRKLAGLEVPPGLTLSFREAAGSAWVGAPAPGLDSMVDNLLENALDSMTSMPGAADLPGPRTIELSLELLEIGEPDRQKHPDLAEGSYWCLQVADHGVGMGPEVINQVFDPYFTTKPDGQGLGLGLPLVYSLAEGLGGFVDLSSTPGVGTVVRVGLPAWKSPPVAGPGSPDDRVILLCDDEPLMRQVAGKILRHLGYNVMEAQDGAAAIDLFRSQASRVRLVILDMVLPGIPGLEVFREIHQLAPRVPVLLSSGFGRGDGVDQAMAEGVAGFLQKPYRAETLAEAVRQALVTDVSG